MNLHKNQKNLLRNYNTPAGLGILLPFFFQRKRKDDLKKNTIHRCRCQK